MKKILFYAVFVLALYSCNKDRTAIDNENNEGIKITATLSAKSNGGLTHAVADGGNSILVSWAENEKIAILYEVSGIKKMAVANIDAVDGTTGSASISFIVDEGTQEGAACTLVYPSSAAKDDYLGVKDVADLLGAQNGTLSANLDVRVGAGIIHTVTPGLAVTVQPEAQFAIFKFTLKNIDASADILVKPLIISIASQNYTITPSSAQSVLYVALPAISGEDVVFSTTGNTTSNNVKKNFEFTKTNVSFAAGKYYQSTLQMIQEETVPAGFAPVDLGLSVKWANMNVGATALFDGGSYYYGWGEIAGKRSSCVWESYKWCNGSNTTLTKYNTGSSYGTVDQKRQLGLADDAAQTVLGGNWRMPTDAEWTELRENCTWTWTTNYMGKGAAGLIVTSNKTGYTDKSIFLKANGYCSTDPYLNGYKGYYWSSSLRTDHPDRAWGVLLESENMSRNSRDRCYGQSIRPVLGSPNII